MKRILLIFTLVALATFFVFNQTQAAGQNDKDAQNLKQFESDWIIASLNRDNSWLERFYSGKLNIFSTNEAVKERASQLGEMIESAIANNPAQASDIKVRVTGNIRVLGGSESESGGNMVSGNRSYDFLDTLNKRNGKWQIIATHFSRASETAVENVEQTIRRIEEQWNEAAVKKDVSTLARIIADDFVGIEGTGRIINKAQAVSSDNSFQSDNLEDIKITVFGDTAIVTGRRTIKGEGNNPKLLFTNVWVRRNGQWQVVNSQSTRIL
jgi:ketosteroid isomerase-like protein